MRILALTRYGRLGASSRLRTLQYLPALRATGFTVDVSPLFPDAYVVGLYAGRISKSVVLGAYTRRVRSLFAARRYDLVWLEKEALPWLPTWIEKWLIGRRTVLAVDYDDADFHRYDRHRLGLVRKLLGQKFDALMRRANLVTVGNEYLARRAQSAGAARAEWLPTVVDLPRYSVVPRRSLDAGCVIGWIGSPSTAMYLQMLTQSLNPLVARGVRCVAIGARPDQVTGTPFEAIEWREDREAALLREIDVGIMPLPDGPFERGKCGYKLIQYMACGLPVVASPVGANTVIVQAGVNGFLAASAVEWTTALTRLVDDVSMRTQMGGAGRRRVEEVYCLQAQAARLVTLLRSVVRET